MRPLSPVIQSQIDWKHDNLATRMFRDIYRVCDTFQRRLNGRRCGRVHQRTSRVCPVYSEQCSQTFRYSGPGTEEFAGPGTKLVRTGMPRLRCPRAVSSVSGHRGGGRRASGEVWLHRPRGRDVPLDWPPWRVPRPPPRLRLRPARAPPVGAWHQTFRLCPQRRRPGARETASFQRRGEVRQWNSTVPDSQDNLLEHRSSSRYQRRRWMGHRLSCHG